MSVFIVLVKNFTIKINPTLILLVKNKFYWQNKSHSYGKIKPDVILAIKLQFYQ